MNKYLFIGALSALALCACSNGEEDMPAIGKKVTLSASQEEPVEVGMKTILKDGSDVEWEAGDAIAVFSASENVKFTTQDEGETATFAGVMESEPLTACYPFAASVSAVGTKISLNVPNVQTYRENSFGKDANISVGEVDNGNIQFKNTLGMLKLNLYAPTGKTAKVSRIVLSSRTDYLWGTFTADYVSESPAATYVSGGSKSVTLKCEEPVELSGDSSDPTSFYIAVPVGALREGFVAEVFNEYDHPVNILYTKATNTIKRSMVRAMPAKEVAFLPEGYTEVRYLESTTVGKQVIKTGYWMKDDINYFKSEAKYMYEKTGDYRPFGVCFSHNTSKTYYYPSYIATNDIRILLNSGGITSGTNWPDCIGTSNWLNKDFEVTSEVDVAANSFIACYNGVEKFKKSSVNTALLPTVANVDDGLTTSVEMYVFDVNYMGQNGAAYKPTPMKLYYLVLFDETGIQRNFIPCLNPESKPGLYDMANGEFYTNAATGEDFTYPETSLLAKQLEGFK